MASQDLTIEPLCPPKDNISCTLTSQSNLFLGPVPTYVSLVSSSLSCIGAIAIIATYILFKDLRIGSRSIITNLSIADLFMSLSCIVGGVNYLVNYRRDDSNMCVIFDTICSIQSYITTWSQLSSYVWNCALAVYLFLTIAFAKNRLANRLIPIFHIIAWGLPIFVALPLLCLNYLGYSPYTSNWCFIRDYNYEHNKWLNTNTMLAFLGGRIIPEFISYLLIIILYSIIKCHICNLKRKLTRLRETSLLEHALQKIDNKLLLIPVVFILLRMWGFIQFFFLLAVSHLSETRGCVSLPIHIIHFILSILEVRRINLSYNNRITIKQFGL
jgi:G protein-coupled receptor 157